jgi:hypothetical protein
MLIDSFPVPPPGLRPARPGSGHLHSEAEGDFLRYVYGDPRPQQHALHTTRFLVARSNGQILCIDECGRTSQVGRWS